MLFGYADGVFNFVTNAQEVIIYSSDQSANRQAIEYNINNYYSIYSAPSGMADAFVSKWYDQVGSNNMVESDVAKQPKIVVDGTLLTDSDNRPIMQLVTDDGLVASSGIGTTADYDDFFSSDQGSDFFNSDYSLSYNYKSYPGEHNNTNDNMYNIRHRIVWNEDVLSTTDKAAIKNLIDAQVSFGDMENWQNKFRQWQSVKEMPVLDTSNGTSFILTWYACSNLEVFPFMDFSSATSLLQTWRSCFALTEFPAIDTSSVTTANRAWNNCSSLTSFPKLNFSSCTNLERSWEGCTSLENFPANVFDDCPCVNFTDAFKDTNLSQTSIDNILVSIDAAGQSNGTFYQSGGSAPSAVGEAAIDSLFAKGWTVVVTGGYNGFYNGASALYSLRRATSSVPNVVRLRRASDNAESDFTAADLVGSAEGAELVTDPDFDTGSLWATTGGWSITGGQAVNSGTDGVVQLNGGIPSGEYVIATINVVACSNFADLKIRVGANTGYSLSSLGITTTGTHKIAAQTQNTALIINTTNSATATIEFLGCKEYTPTAAEQWVIDGIGVTTQSFAYATTWYDQSGSGNDATQATAAAQPLLVRAGVTNTENGKAALSFDGTDDWLDLDTSSFDIGSLSSFGVLALNQTGGSMMGVALGSYFSNKRFYAPYVTGGNFNFGYGTSFTLFPSAADTDQHLHTLIAGSVLGGVEGFRDGSSQGTTSLLSGNDTSTRGIGGRSDGFNWDGTVQEVIVYDSDQSDNRYDIESSINDYYNIYYDSTTPIVGGIQAPVASAAYSLRSLDGDATANVVRLRRASDNEERDFTAADLVGGVEGAELLTNGDFATGDFTGWTAGSDWSVVGGVATLNYTGGGSVLTTSNLSGMYGVPGVYKLTFDVTCSDYPNFKFSAGNATVTLPFIGITADGTYSLIFDTRNEVTDWGRVAFLTNQIGLTATIDNVSLVPYTPTAAEEWVIEDGGYFYQGRMTATQTQTALVTTLYDQAASNEQVFDGPTIIAADWSHAVGSMDYTISDGRVSFSNVTGYNQINHAIPMLTGIVAGKTYRVEVDYENLTHDNGFALVLQLDSNVFTYTNAGTGSGTATRDIVSAVSGDVRGWLQTHATIAYANGGVDITGIRVTEIGNPATQTTSTAQPKLITAGVTELENGKPAMVFDGTDDYLINEALQATQATTFFSVAELVASMRLVTGTDGINRQLTYVSGNVIALYAGGFVNTGSSVSADFGNQTVITSVFNGASSAIYRDGASYDTGDAGAGNLDGLIIGANYTFTGFNPGRVQEIILYDSDQSANRRNIETNINNHYNIY
jgi:hypothetical protein